MTAIIIILITSCSQRERNNPFDPDYPESTMNMRLSIIPMNRYNQLLWNKPHFTDYSGFNIYRKKENDSTFQLIKYLPGEYRTYSDSMIEYGNEHQYYFKVSGNGIESKRSAIVSTTPGPGYNWIMDKWGYQFIKTSYDTKYIISRAYTNAPPHDMAIAKEYNTALITYPSSCLIEIIDMKTNDLLFHFWEMLRPYAVCYDSTANYFWLIDSTGFLYSIHANSFQIRMVNNTLKSPNSISISDQSGLINITDYRAKEILFYNRDGEMVEKIDSINNSPLQGPEKFIYDEQRQRYWISDDRDSVNFIFTKLAHEDNFHHICTLDNAGDMELCTGEDAIYLISLSQNNSSIMKLYADGIRQTIINNLYFPLDLVINIYDETILVADSYYSRVLHYDQNNNLLGYSNFYNFPLKILIE